MDFVLLLGRVLFSLLFITSGVGHFTHRVPMAGYAKSMGAPAPELTVPLTGAMILLGGLMVLLGFYARVGAVLILLFLVPTAFIMHRFWGVPDAMMAQNQRVHFMKNLALAGAALIVAYFGSGPYSIRP
jgi:putative oxidoreductase